MNTIPRAPNNGGGTAGGTARLRRAGRQRPAALTCVLAAAWASP